MNFFFDTLRKLLTFTFGILFTFVLTYAPYDIGKVETVPEAAAQWAVIDAANLTQNALTAVNTTAVSSKEIVLDNIGWVLAKATIANIMASTIDWINSGFQGSPAFVQDLDRFLLNVGDQVAGAYLEELGGEFSFLCSPFRLNIQIALALEYQTARERVPYQGCLLSETFDNFDDFIAGDFLQGGWDDFVTVVANPGQYTEYGALLTAESTFQERLFAAEENERQTLDFGQGFLSSEVCEDTTGPAGQTTERCRIVTPGNAIADRLNSVLGTSENALITADEINEVIGALVSTLSVKAISGTAGLLGLSANTNFTYPGFDGGSFTNNIRSDANNNQTQTIGTAAQSLDTTLAIQQDYRTLAQTYNSRANQVAQTTNNPTLRSDALRIVSDTTRVVQNTNQYIVEISADIAAYNALSNELSNPNITQARRDEIRAEQTTLVVGVVQGKYYTAAQMESSEIIWENGLNPQQNPPTN